LVNIPIIKGENVLLFLVQTAGRQSAEQRQYRPARARGGETNGQDTEEFAFSAEQLEAWSDAILTQ